MHRQIRAIDELDSLPALLAAMAGSDAADIGAYAVLQMCPALGHAMAGMDAGEAEAFADALRGRRRWPIAEAVGHIRRAALALRIAEATFSRAPAPKRRAALFYSTALASRTHLAVLLLRLGTATSGPARSTLPAPAAGSGV